MTNIELNKEVLIPSSLNVLNQEQTISNLKNENKLLTSSIILIVIIVGAFYFIENKKNKKDENK